MRAPGRVEGQRPFEGLPRVGPIADRLQREAELLPERRAVGRYRRRGREDHAGQAGMPRRPMRQRQPPQRLGGRRVLAKQSVELAIARSPGRDSSGDFACAEIGDDPRQVGSLGLEHGGTADVRLRRAGSEPRRRPDDGVLRSGGLGRGFRHNYPASKSNHD